MFTLEALLTYCGIEDTLDSINQVSVCFTHDDGSQENVMTARITDSNNLWYVYSTLNHTAVHNTDHIIPSDYRVDTVEYDHRTGEESQTATRLQYKQKIDLDLDEIFGISFLRNVPDEIALFLYTDDFIYNTILRKVETSNQIIFSADMKLFNHEWHEKYNVSHCVYIDT